MQFGKALIGALVGGVLGIGVLVLIHSLTGWDKYWLAIPVALLTGLGVRWMVSTKGHPSYARGALTAVVAMLAFFAWYPIMAQITTRKSIAQPVVIEREDADDDAEADAPADGGATVEPVRMEEPAPMGDAAMRNARQQEISAWDIISLCLAAFIAYELGRGSGPSTSASQTTSRDDEVPPVAVGQTAAPPE